MSEEENKAENNTEEVQNADVAISDDENLNDSDNSTEPNIDTTAEENNSTDGEIVTNAGDNTENEQSIDTDAKSASPADTTENISAHTVAELNEITKYAEEIQRLSNQYLAEPQAPGSPDKPRDEDPEAWEQYRVDNAVYKTQKVQYEVQQRQLQNTRAGLLQKQVQKFNELHTPEEARSFGQWLNNDPYLTASIENGHRDLNKAYKLFIAETKQEHSQKRMAEIKRQGASFKVVDVNKRGVTANGQFAGLRYANMPEYRDFAAQLMRDIDPTTGKKFTAKDVDRLVRKQYERDFVR